MTPSIVECIPNFSEGRRMEVVDAIVRSLQTGPEVHILDRHSDPDHNRTVITLAGSPESLELALMAAIAIAADRIDMARHTGAHPRIGATDVVPFVPLRGITYAECILLARRLGRRVGEELKIPVYFYGDAATTPARRNLPGLRKGEFEGLLRAIIQDPTRKPDYGPNSLSPAGAIAIGVRGPLIAFNIFLDTQRLEVAREIATKIRESSGGLPAVQAMGMLVRGRAQVSMNLTNYTRTSISAVFETVQREADRLCVSVASSEIVGLVPAAALQGIDLLEIKLEPSSYRNILEERLAAAGMGSDWPELARDSGPT
jgi:glutamate formiminotransferase / formiminotetrahydrofolate cyclodeaminase